MTETINELAEVIGKNVNQSPRGIALSIIDALPELVVPLEWEDHLLSGEPVLSRALVQGGGYFICDDKDDFTGAYLVFVSCDKPKWWQNVRSTSVELQGNFQSDDIAPLKAAAQADYTCRILAALGVAR